MHLVERLLVGRLVIWSGKSTAVFSSFKRLSNTCRYYIRIDLTCLSPTLSCYGCDFDLGLLPQAVSRLDVATKSG